MKRVLGNVRRSPMFLGFVALSSAIVVALGACSVDVSTNPTLPVANTTLLAAIEDDLQSNQTRLPTAMDATNVYFTTRASIFSCPKTGCGAGPVKLREDAPEVNHLAVYERFLFWTSRSTGVSRCTLPACTDTKVIPNTAGASTGNGARVAVDGTRLVMSTDGLKWCDLPDCTTPTPIFVGGVGGNIEQFVLLNNRVFRIDVKAGSNSGYHVVSCSIDACPVDTARQQNILQSEYDVANDALLLTADAGAIYYYSLGEVFRAPIPKAAGDAPKSIGRIASVRSADFIGAAFTTKHMYFAISASGPSAHGIMACDRTPAGCEGLRFITSSGQGVSVASPGSLSTDGASLVWLATGFFFSRPFDDNQNETSSTVYSVLRTTD